MLLTITRFIYNLLFLLILPLLFIRLFIRSFKNPEYRHRWLERIGIFTAPKQNKGIWIHTVSVGEFIAALPIIKKLQQLYPNELIIVTTTTVTGSARVKANLGDSVFHVYMPYDLSYCIKGFFKRIKPKICIILETELWKNLIYYCEQYKVPVILINARLSPNSFRNYKKFKWIVKNFLNKLTKVMVQSDVDKERFLQLGLLQDKISIPGNIKYDVQQQEKNIQDGNKLKKSFGERIVLIAASTHDDEEKKILDVFQIIKKQHKKVLLVLVPRHPERFDAVCNLIETYKFNVIRRSLLQQCTNETDVLLGDTMGEMGIFYQASDMAFVGGSLVPIGGHNMLEAALVGIPIVTGPYLHNFSEISQKLVDANGMKIVDNVADLSDVLLEWIGSSTIRKEIGANAKSVLMQNQGATKKIIDSIHKIIAGGIF